uniref:PHTB1_C domain-containing protein n=1 Tax=Gongylonema pulchrum TaxID=637853 RepID=A0A183EGM2_9BILA
LDRQTWVAIKLIRCLNHLSGVLSTEKMRELTLNGILNRKNTQNDSVASVSCKREASQKIDQLLGGLHQIMNLRGELNSSDAERFDDRIEPIRLQIQAVVNALNAFILTTTEIPEPKNIYDDLYEEYLRPQQLEENEQQQQQKQMRLNSMRLRVQQAKMDAAETKKLAS